MSSTNDSPSVDKQAGNEGIGNAGIHATAENEEEDSHCCGKCQKIFTSLESYLQHKFTEHKYTVKYDKSSKIPHLVEKPANKRPVGRPRKDASQPPPEKTVKKAKLDDTVVLLVDEIKEYNCDACHKTFRRAAALRRHQDYDHREKGSDEEDEPEIIDLDAIDGEDFTVSEAELADEETEEQDADKSIAEQDDVESSAPRSTPRQTVSKPAASRALSAMVIDEKQITHEIAEIEGIGSLIQVSSQRPFGCKQCGRRFKEYSVLRAHMLTHSDDRPFKCSYPGCPYAFKTKGSQKRHERRHTDERPFSCELCGRTFRESGALTRHQKSRTVCTSKSNSELPRYGKLLPIEDFPKFRNPTCNILSPGEIPKNEMPSQGICLVQEGEQIFMQMADGLELNANNLVNTLGNGDQETILLIAPEEKYTPNLCKACRITFKDEQELENHLKEHLSHLPFRCGLCTFAAQTKNLLNSHMRESHNTKLKSWRKAKKKATTDKEDSCLDETEEASQEIQGEAYNTGFPIICESDMGEVIISEDIVTVDEGNIDEVAEAVQNSMQDAQIVGKVAAPDNMHDDNRDAVNIETIAEAGDKGTDTDEEMEKDAQIGADEEAAVLDQQAIDQMAPVALQQLIDLMTKGGQKDEATGATMVKTLHRCPECSRCFTTGTYLDAHMKVHLDMRVFVCEICNKSFHTLETLEKHKLQHTQDRRYKCGDCGKLFKRITAVREHFRSHSNDRPYNCEVCNKAFKSANALKVHLRTHTEQLPYQCEVCDRQFREKSSLDRHTRIHTGEKPFVCVHCHRGFAEHGTLARHLRAKMPCCSKLAQIRATHGEDADLDEGILSGLASVVGDQEEYIIEAEVPPQDDQVAMEYVMVKEEGTENIQNIQILTGGAEGLDMGALPPGTQFVLVDPQNAGETVTMFHPETGQQIEVLHSDIEDPVTIIDSSQFDADIHSIAMVPDAVEETVAMDMNQIEAVAMAPDAVQQAMMDTDVHEEILS